MTQGIKEFVRMAREDSLTTICAVVFGISSLIVAQPTVISFLSPASALLAVQISEFIQKASVVVGLIFAAQSKPGDLQTKDVIPEVLAENQPEGKEELQNPTDSEKPAILPTQTKNTPAAPKRERF